LINQILCNNLIGNNNQSIKLLPYKPCLKYSLPEADRTWPAYILRRGPFLAHLVFSNEKAYKRTYKYTYMHIHIHASAHMHTYMQPYAKMGGKDSMVLPVYI